MNFLAKNTLDMALALARKEIYVSPAFGLNGSFCNCKNNNCWRVGKHPFFQEEPKKSSIDKNTINSWWRGKNFNLVVHTGVKSRLTVIDIDTRAGGLATFAQNLAALEMFNSTFSVETGSGGFHFYFRCNDEIFSEVDAIAPGIDLCSQPKYTRDLSFVIGPYSQHKSGNLYKIRNNLPIQEITSKEIYKIKELV